MTNQINDRGLEAASKAMYDCGENDGWVWENETSENKATVNKACLAAIQAYIPFHQLANQEDCREATEKFWHEHCRKYKTNISHYEFREIWQAAYQSRPVGDGWLPIESAPRDGTRIIGYFEHTMPDMQITVVRFAHDDTYGYELWIDDGGMGWTEPTHWMPLPTALESSERV